MDASTEIAPGRRRKQPSGPGLVCAATRAELEAFGLENARAVERHRLWRIEAGHALVTGVGIPFAMLNLLPRVGALRPRWLLNLGIAGAYPGSDLEIGDVVVGVSETFADLGFEIPDGEVFRPLAKAPFADPRCRKPLKLWVPKWAAAKKLGMRMARGATVNRCAGRDGTGYLRRRLFGADFESMEGAACALIGAELGVPVLEIRAISNSAGDRVMRPENVKRALRSLRVFWEKNRRFLP